MEPSVVNKLQREAASRRLRAASIGIHTAVRKLGEALIRYLADDLDLPEGDQFNIVSYLRVNYDELKTRDWSGFSIKLNSIPAIDAYLSDYPLAGQIDQSIEIAINDWIAEYHATFFAYDEPTVDTPLGKYIGFFMESHLLGHCFAMLTELLKAKNPKDVETIAKEIGEIMKRSALLHFLKKNYG